jgi:hypothetical protein
MRKLLEQPPFAQRSVTGDVVCEHALAQSRVWSKETMQVTAKEKRSQSRKDNNMLDPQQTGRDRPDRLGSG